jgi:hypothetical protein
MSSSARTRAAVTWAALFAFAAIVDLARGHDLSDDDSYLAGYTAVSNPSHARALMALPGTSSGSVCDALLDRVLVSTDASRLIEADFVSGCQHAIADAME